ncbi:MAG: protein kinase [Dehalococcoidia bacterium]
MPSERIQRRIDALLDEVEEAAQALQWERVRELCDGVLRLDPDNEDAKHFLQAANRDTGVASTSPPSQPAKLATEQPASFAGGRYEVRRFLGEGGKKRVFLAHDARLDRDVAFALIKTKDLDATGRERITREAQAMGRLGAHPHIVTIFEIGEEAGSPYVVNELLGGGDVEGELEKAGGPLPLARTLEIAKGVCRGLAFAHERGIVHRDLKPGNVWLTEDGTAKIGDFGLAVSLDRSRLTQHGMMVGTVAYMPPEQALGGEVTPQADLYSLGAMLYELVTGRPPFQADDPTAIISQHINTPPVAPSWHSEHCPPDLEALILKLLAKVPADRPASVLEAMAALEAVDPEARSASHSDSSANPLDRLARGVFVGRERELERLRSAFDEAFSGRGSVVMLVGEPGIGKTRTSLELETYARMRGGRVIWGRAHEAAGAPPYRPWVQAADTYSSAWGLDSVGPLLAAEDIAELSRVFPLLRQQPGYVAPPEIVDPAAAQFRLFEAYTKLLRSFASEAPLVVVLDDLHWADKPTLLLLQHVARELGRLRVLIVGTYRDTELSRTHPLSETLAELNREGGFQRVNLSGLERDEVANYIRGTAGLEPSRALVDRVHEETEGNPFFLHEIVNLMTEEGTISSDSVSDIAIPEGVREALGRRLDRLSEDANALLQYAAVAGRQFAYDTLKLVTQHDDESLLRLIEEGLEARVIEETSQPGRYQFTHALMQETLLEELSTTRRVRMHGDVAEAIEQRYGDRAEQEAARLAVHFAEASTLAPTLAAKAFHYSRVAASRAADGVAWDEAIGHLQRCLGLLHDVNVDEDEAALLIELARCQTAALDNRGAWESSSRAQDIYIGRNDPVGTGHALLIAANAGALWGGAGELSARRSEALRALGESDTHLTARLLAFDFGLRVPDADVARAGELARAFDYPDVAARVEMRGAMKAYEALDLPAARAHFGAAHVAHERAGEFVDAAQHLRFVGFSLLHEGRVDESAEANRQALAYARRVGARLTEHIALVYLADVELLRGNFDRVEELGHECPSGFYWMPLLQAARLEQLGQAQDALQLVPPSEVSGEFSGAHVHGARARLLLNSGDREGAAREVDQWTQWLGRGLPDEVLASPMNSEIHFAEVDEALPALGAVEAVKQSLEMLRRWPMMRVGRTSGRGFDHIRGNLALRIDFVDEAEQHFRTGLEWCERERCPVEAGRCHQGLAEVAERRGDHALAMQHLDAAGELFSRHGAKLYLDQVLAKKEILKA